MRKLLAFCIISLFLLFFPMSDAFAIEYEILPVNPVMIAPFILLLLSIALMPFINRHWWEHNYPLVSFALGAVTVVYYFFILKNAPRMIHTAIEYFSFISLIGSLFVVAGGIHIRVKGRSTPLANVILLGIGAVISNLLGTTGASMVLIRPYIRLNKYRISAYHIVFFIFIVSNIGGMLTPIGDPPLFLGYLKGVPFFWVITRVWYIWLISVALILLIFYIIDRHHYKKLPDEMEKEIESKGEEAVVEGLHNVIFLFIILGAVFLKEPIREIIMIASAVASYLTTKREIHERNDFNFIPIKEVAILFAGIFATMVPALDWLELNAEKLGITHPGQFFWGTGILSSFLDNAPTYLNFLSAAFGLHGLNVDNPVHMKAMLGLLSPNDLAHLEFSHNFNVLPITADSWRYVQAISVSAVMFGAMTYIGNGPNFMVKSIAEQFRIKMPSFFGYMIKYSIPILLPIFTFIWFVFFR
ncbi:MAG: sodium:proton antiporter [Candidatus Kryptonium sp.]|nr:sodium:proton antiporter [Candidatus Kryptonium sp.]MDW8109705.1 sodium:proton antiporter [Candidatus Kryptonium sp.]